MGIPLIQVDAFTDRPFAGNPAGVCLLPGPREADWMQQVAQEMNLSETAFLYPEADGYRLRWFTPAVEVDLCGHATLASAHVLWELGREAPDATICFHTRSGLLTVRRQGGEIELDFPANLAEPADPPPGLVAALGAPVQFVGKNQFDYLVELATEADVHGLRPDLARLGELPVRGIIVTARATTAPFDFVSRFFAPASGVPEDPVTGSAHCCLAPFWRERLGKDAMLGWQVSRRGGVVGVRVAGSRVLLTGQAVTVLRGELLA